MLYGGGLSAGVSRAVFPTMGFIVSALVFRLIDTSSFLKGIISALLCVGTEILVPCENELKCLGFTSFLSVLWFGFCVRVLLLSCLLSFIVES